MSTDEMKTANTDLYAPNIDELLRQWDGGQAIFTIECGGLGPGYEQCIQIAAIEFARATKELKDLKPDDKESTDRFKAVCDEVVHKLDKDLGGMSGAQVGAAQWLAWRWTQGGGPEKLIEDCKGNGEPDRVIQVSKFFPKAP